mgnify:CR=1 FL=1
MKFYKIIIFILIVFFKTETLLSDNNLFNVNNIQLEKKGNITNNDLANRAIKKGFDQLTERILLSKDIKKLKDLNFSQIKQLVTYYQIKSVSTEKKNEELINFSVTFDKNKIHNLFYKKGISYSEISQKELYVLPVLIKENKIFIFNKNLFYKNWNDFYQIDLIDFVLPLENIEIIKNINDNKNNLFNLKLTEIFREYPDKNLALIFIEQSKDSNEKIYIQAKIQGKSISKGINLKKENLKIEKYYEQIITEIKKELVNLVKSENLIDVRTPSFLNVKLGLNKKSNLVELNSRIKSIDLIENIYVQEFNKNYMNLTIKYLGKLDKIIDSLKQKKINLQLINDQWIIKTL